MRPATSEPRQVGVAVRQPVDGFPHPDEVEAEDRTVPTSGREVDARPAQPACSDPEPTGPRAHGHEVGRSEHDVATLGGEPLEGGAEEGVP